jgi:hypothetical protein
MPDQGTLPCPKTGHHPSSRFPFCATTNLHVDMSPDQGKTKKAPILRRVTTENQGLEATPFDYNSFFTFAGS